MPADEQNGKQAVILVVDDNPQNLELLEIHMEGIPEARIVTATNGVEAMDRVAEHKPDLVLLDIMMPRMSGFEVCKRIKNDPDTADTVVIMVTALNESCDMERAAECGTDDYITKPIDRKALLDLVRSHLSAKARD